MIAHNTTQPRLNRFQCLCTALKLFARVKTATPPPSPVCVKLRINHKGNISRVAVLHALRRLGHDAHFFDGDDGPLLVVRGRK